MDIPRLLGGWEGHMERPTLNLSPRSLWTISSSSLAVLLQNWEKSLIQRSLSLACSEQIYFRVRFTHAHACMCTHGLTDTLLFTATPAHVRGVSCHSKTPALRNTITHELLSRPFLPTLPTPNHLPSWCQASQFTTLGKIGG